MSPKSKKADKASVVVIGAGLSGLLTARELGKAGVKDVVVLDARDRIGGRLGETTLSNGTKVMTGGELTGPAQKKLHELAAEYDIHPEPFPGMEDPETMGLFVRVVGDERIVEPYPFASDEAGGAEYGAIAGRLDELSATVPSDKPWEAERAKEWDHISIGQWLDEQNIKSAAARSALETDLWTYLDLYEVSFLQLLWNLAGFGGWEAFVSMHDRLSGGTAQIPQLLAKELDGQIHLSTPVTKIERDDKGVTVHFEGGAIKAKAVVVAMQPSQAAKIEFSPALPYKRQYLQSRWTGGVGAKYFAVYETPFWREEGLAGLAFGKEPCRLAADFTPEGADFGLLLAGSGGGGSVMEEYGERLSDPETERELVLETLAFYFGEKALKPTEFLACTWVGDRWSDGAGTVLPLGLLSTVGSALREPVGRMVWAGTDTGDQDWMEGAVTSAYRAAREAADLV